MISGGDVEAKFASAKTPFAVDAVVEELLAGGDVPDYIAVDPWKVVEIAGGGHTLQILVAPDYLAFGSPPFRAARLSPFGAQAAADAFDAILPSRKIVREVQRAASPQIPFVDVKAPPWSIPVSKINQEVALVAANDAAAGAFSSRGIAPGDDLPLTYAKSIVTGPGLDGSKVAIYGGLGPNLDPASGRREVMQPYSTVHASGAWSDYSHRVMLVSRKAELDGRAVDLRTDVFGSKDPAVVALVNDHGVIFDPIFPNAGPTSRATFGGGTFTAPGKKGGGGPIAKPPTPARSSAPSFATLGKALGVLAAIGLGFWYWAEEERAP